MGKIKCFKCNGKGHTRKCNGLLAVATLGWGTLLDMDAEDPCSACGGSGYLEE